MDNATIVHENENTTIWVSDVGEDGNPFSVQRWIIKAPWMHMCWEYHYVGLIHLRDVEGHEPANIQFQGATHELIVLAMNPDAEPSFSEPQFLTPISIAQQFVAENDAEALEKIEFLLNPIAEGRLSVDSDFRSTWQHMLLDHDIHFYREQYR